VSIADLRAPAATIAEWPAFLVLYWQPITTLVRDWLTDPDSAHGLLLFPVAVWLMWRRGRSPAARPQRAFGLVVLGLAVAMRLGAGMAAELFTMRLSLFGALAGLTIYHLGLPQLLRWWLPALLLILSIPIPDVLLNTLALPLQLQASRLGAALLSLRHVPVSLAGNVIHLPGQSLFVTEACSGLRSLTALVALGLLVGGLWLRTTAGRVALVVAAIPVAIALNGLRVFLTGFMMFYVSPAVGQGVMHYSEGWAIFVAAFGILGVLTWLVSGLEQRWPRAA
jgi:exosortase